MDCQCIQGRIADEWSVDDRNIIVVRSHYLPRLTQTIYEDGTTDNNGQAETTNLFEERLPDFATLRDLLLQLLLRSNCAVVFGGLIEASRNRAVRRRARKHERRHKRSYVRAQP